jgi:hypothetical protein
MRGLIRIQIISAAGAILFAGSVVADDWSYYQHDASHTGNSGAVVDPQALLLAWTAPSWPTGYSTPVIVGNRIYAMQNQGGTVTSGRRLVRSIFRLAQSTGVTPATLNFRRSQASAVGCHLCRRNPCQFLAIRAECNERYPSLHGTNSGGGDGDDADCCPRSDERKRYGVCDR